MRKWLPAVLIAITYILSMVMLPRLPAVVSLDLGPLLPLEIEGESGPRAWFAFAIPTVALALWLFFLWATSRAGLAALRRMFGRWAPADTLEPYAIARFRPTYDLVVALVIAFVVAFHLTLVALAAGGPPSTVRGFLLLVGLGLAAMGNVMPRIRPNPIMGLRTRATLNDPVLWARMHRLFGGLLVASGVLVMLLALVAVQYALIGFLAALLLSCVIVFAVLVNGVQSRPRVTRST
jgi:immunity protein, SdpI family